MRGLLIAGALAMLATPAATIGQSTFTGTWKVDFNSAMPKKVNVWLLQHGTYKCKSCSPIVDVRADGKDQPVKGQPYDTICIKIVDPRTVEEIEKKNGQVVSDEKFTVSQDGLRSNERKDFIGSIEHPDPGTGADGDLYCAGVSIRWQWYGGKAKSRVVAPELPSLAMINIVEKPNAVPTARDIRYESGWTP